MLPCRWVSLPLYASSCFRCLPSLLESDTTAAMMHRRCISQRMTLSRWLVYKLRASMRMMLVGPGSSSSCSRGAARPAGRAGRSTGWTSLDRAAWRLAECGKRGTLHRQAPARLNSSALSFLCRLLISTEEHARDQAGLSRARRGTQSSEGRRRRHCKQGRQHSLSGQQVEQGHGFDGEERRRGAGDTRSKGDYLSPRRRRASWMSFGWMVTRLAWMACVCRNTRQSQVCS